VRSPQPKGSVLEQREIAKLEAYLQKTFRSPSIRVKPRPKKDDSAEVYVGDEFIGILFRDDEDDELSYQFQMAILEYDLA
jgi:hypothetical protein